MQEMNPNKETTLLPSVGALAFARYKKRFGYSLPMTAGFTVVALAFLLMGVFFPYTLWFIVPFVVLPLFLAFTISLCDGHKNNELSNRRSFAYFLSYFHTPFYGSYRVIWNFILSLLFSLPFALIFYFSLVPIFTMKYPSFGESLSSLYSLLHAGDYSSVFAFIEKEESLFSFMSLFSLLSCITFTVIFLFRLCDYALNPFLRVHMGPGPSSVANHIFVGGLKKAKKSFLRDYYSSIWWMLVAFFAFFAFGITIGWFFLLPMTSPLGIVTLGILFGLVAVSPFLPYYIWVLDLLFKKYCYFFIDYSISLAEEALSEMDKMKDIPEEEKEEIKNQVEESKKTRKDMQDKMNDAGSFFDDEENDGKD